ncbi:MAG: hypothetical protein ACR2NZ_04545 [Rubripirellula sp.]
MDGTTESIIVVIGDPIAGNPVQFAAERALRSLRLDWRVLSFDVKPEHVATALGGFDVTGIDGVFVDPSLCDQAREWLAARNEVKPESIDSLYRDDQGQFVGANEQREWIDEQIARHGGDRRVWIGDHGPNAAATCEGFEMHDNVPSDLGEVTANADVIVISDRAGKPVELEPDEWADNDGGTLVIDLTNGHPDFSRIKQRGYRVVCENERRIGTLQRSLHRWTGEYASADVIHDAIEEYLSV